jgi:enoyl-CoA hydratase/carnithine racemase
MSTAESSSMNKTPPPTPNTEWIAERFTLKAIVEACLVLEEGIAGVREIDLGLMLGTGMVPGPFARADFRGLDDVLAALERAEQEWGEHFAPPLILRRLVAQGRLGAKSGQGFYPYPQPEPGYENAPVKLDRRGDDIAVLWLDNPPANSLSPAVVEALEQAWGEVDGQARAVIVASPNPALFCAGADLKAFTTMDAQGGKAMLDRAHALLRSFERSRTMMIAAVNGMALGGGCELAMGCDVRIAAYSASFGQPEINLGIIPGFGGTQRLPRLVGPAKALEMNATGDPISAEDAYDFGLVNRVVADHELFDTAIAWARKFARQAPLALEQIKRVSHKGDLDEGIEAEKEGFATVFGSEDAREGIGAFLGKRTPKFKGA